MDHSLLIHSPTEGHPGCLQNWEITNKAALNFHVQVSAWMSVFSSFQRVPRSPTAGLHGESTFHFRRNRQTIPQYGCTVLHSRQQLMGVSCCPVSSPARGGGGVLGFGHSDRGVVVSHHYFNFHFQMLFILSKKQTNNVWVHS